MAELFKTPLFNDPNLEAYWRLQGINAEKNSNPINSIVGFVSQPALFDNGFGNSANTNHMTVTDSANLNANIASTNALTISLWVKFVTGTGASFLLHHGRDSASTAGWQLGYQLFGSGNGFSCSIGYGGGTLQAVCDESSLFTVSTGVWYHIAATWNGSTMLIYRNAVQVGSNALGAQTIFPQSFDLDWGNRRTAGGVFQNIANIMILDDVAIFSRALSQAEITTLFTPSSKIVPPNSLRPRIFAPGIAR